MAHQGKPRMLLRGSAASTRRNSVDDSPKGLKRKSVSGDASHAGGDAFLNGLSSPAQWQSLAQHSMHGPGEAAFRPHRTCPLSTAYHHQAQSSCACCPQAITSGPLRKGALRTAAVQYGGSRLRERLNGIGGAM